PAPLKTVFELDSEHDFDLDTPTAMDQSGLEGCCLVVRIPHLRLVDSGTRVRITVRGSTTGDLKIDKIYISQAADSVDPSKDPYDSLDADLTPVVDGGVLVPAGESRTLGFLYILDREKDLIVAFDISSTPGFGNLRHVDFPDVSVPVTYF